MDQALNSEGSSPAVGSSSTSFLREVISVCEGVLSAVLRSIDPTVLVGTLTIVIVLATIFLRQKKFLQYRPRLRSHVARTSSESCLWLQRACDATFRMLQNADLWSKVSEKLTQRVTSTLEDSGLLQNVDFRIRTIGTCGPCISAIRMAPTPSGAASKQTVEFECDISYEGGFGFSLAAFFPLWLGAGANFRIDVSSLKFFCHAKVKATVADATKDVGLELQLVSKPTFSFNYETKLVTRLRYFPSLKNTAIVYYATRFLLVYLITKKLVAPACLKLRIPLPPALDPQQPLWNQLDTECSESLASLSQPHDVDDPVTLMQGAGAGTTP
jgi:hypothetical protein